MNHRDRLHRTLSKDQVSHRSVWRNPIHFLAFGLGSGVVPVLPGTAGTLLAIPFYLLLSHFSPLIYALITVLLFVLGIYVCGTTARYLNYPDYPGIVWDEMVGYFITMFLIPKSLVSIILGFILFRLFDIWKPWPIGWCNHHIHGGFGIMFDDLLAAIYAWCVLQLLMLSNLL